MPTHVCVCARVWIRKLVATEVEFSKFNFFNALVSLTFHSSIHLPFPFPPLPPFQGLQHPISRTPALTQSTAALRNK